ncbi:MAG: TIM barrel protein [Pigmentiphaga sp.]|uniref:hydroxypyruvate isomerase family protein n=1 Tax=Pigmentiphaga sp. TaxID=1977564 RepID=UPI0029B7C1B2|nr:TIM barrel protein [Pigmentiphaga sp.]MDX3907427.1 TIM barrel protein [Pigmentiphaga sp.]
MIRFSANLSMLFREVPELERPAAARRAGFEAVEMQFPYDHEAVQWRAALDTAGVELVLYNIPAGDFMTGGQGLAGVPGREDAFREAVAQAAQAARVLRPRNVNVLAGCPGPEHDRERCLDTLAANLQYAARVMADIGVGVVIEAINSVDRPGYLIDRTQAALAAIDRAGHPNLRLQYDIYHMQVMEGDLIRTLRTHCARIGHIQFADNPGRHEPGTGEIHFGHVFAALDQLPYDGFVGAEYLPSRRTEDTLDWLQGGFRRSAETAR